MNLPWFRFYVEFATDPTIQVLAFEDQRHFAMALCMKGMGLLDREFPTPSARSRVVCVTLGLDPLAAAEANRRLREVGLVDESWQPLNWDKRQHKSDHDAADRQRRSRENRALVTVTTMSRDSHGLDTDTESEGDTDQKQETNGLMQPVVESGSSDLTKADPQGFDEFERLYPKRSGSQRWADARSAFRARLREGTPLAELLAGAKRYAAYVRAGGFEGSSRVQQAATFVGTNRCYAEPWEPETARAANGKPKADPYARAI